MKMQFFISLSFILLGSIGTIKASELRVPHSPVSHHSYSLSYHSQIQYYYPSTYTSYTPPSSSSPQSVKAESLPSKETDVKFSSEIRASDQRELQEIIKSKDIDSMVALACSYKDMDKKDTALKLFEAANSVASSQEVRLESRARAYWGELLLAAASSREKGVTLIVDAAIEDDDSDAIRFLLEKDGAFKKYIGKNASDESSKKAKELLKSLLSES